MGKSAVLILEDSYAMAPRSLLYEGGDRRLERMYVYTYLIRHPQGDILFDLGTPSAESVRERYGYILHDKKPIDQTLRAQGVDPASIRTIIVSHLHWDHFNENALLFPNAVFYLQRSEAQDAAAPKDPGEYDRAHVALVCRELYDRFVFVDGDRELAPGVRLIRLPGHTVGLQGAVVDTAAGRVVLASDAAFNFHNLERDVPPGAYVDRAQTMESMARVRQEGEIILPQHEVRVMRMYPSGRIG